MQSPTSTPNASSNPNAIRILIVEDEPDIARLIAVTLGPMRLDLRMATTGLEALQAFEQIQPHLVLLDIMLPGLDGRQVCAKIRETSTVPVIMMTAMDSEEAQLDGLKAGADDYISKPFAPKLLAARVAAQLRRVYRYDAQPTREETAAERQQRAMEAETQRRQRAMEATLGIAPVAQGERKVPPGWASCESCGYMGPRAKFDQEDSKGRRSAACPACKNSEALVFSLG